jgi:plasmid stabilization system protein ParE
MKVVYTVAALADLDEIADWLGLHYPSIASDVERTVRAAVVRVAHWPESARRSDKRPAVRVVPVVRYPYRIFYRVTADAVEILHIHHAARRPWDEES